MASSASRDSENITRAVVLAKDQDAALNEVARIRRSSRSAMVREAVDLFLASNRSAPSSIRASAAPQDDEVAA